MPAHFLGDGVEAAKRNILGKIGALTQQRTVAGEPEDRADAMTLAESDGLDAPVVAVAADQNLHARPTGTDVADDMTQHAGNLDAVGRLARAQEDRHRLAGGGLIDMDGQEAVAAPWVKPEGRLHAR